jgi:hypothetical protein
MPRLAIPRRDLDPRAPYAQSLNKALADPDPVIGWAGDPSCFMAWNRLENRWEVWRQEPEGDRLIARAPSGERLDVTKLLKGLVERDMTLRNNSAVKQVERILEHNEKLERERTRNAEEVLQERLEKVYHAAVSGGGGREYGYVRPVSLSGAWRDK